MLDDSIHLIRALAEGQTEYLWSFRARSLDNIRNSIQCLRISWFQDFSCFSIRSAHCVTSKNISALILSVFFIPIWQRLPTHFYSQNNIIIYIENITATRLKCVFSVISLEKFLTLHTKKKKKQTIHSDCKFKQVKTTSPFLPRIWNDFFFQKSK